MVNVWKRAIVEVADSSGDLEVLHEGSSRDGDVANNLRPISRPEELIKARGGPSGQG